MKYPSLLLSLVCLAFVKPAVSDTAASSGASGPEASTPSATLKARSRRAFDPDQFRRMPSPFRLSFLGGAGLYIGEKNFENDNQNLTGISGNILLAYGQNSISFETGATFLNAPYAAGSKDENGTHRALVNVQYVGVPLIIKYNYIERPLASFFVKVGAIPVMVVRQSNREVILKDGRSNPVVLPKNDVLAVAGFGGTSELTNTTAFVVDFTAFYGTTPSDANSHVQGLTGSLGLSFEL